MSRVERSPIMLLALLAAWSCGDGEPERQEYQSEPEGACPFVCVQAQATTCEHILDAPGPRSVSVVVPGEQLAEFGGFDRVCQGVVTPFEFLTSPEDAYHRLCAGSESCAVRVCGRVDPHLRDRITGLPLFTVCEFERAE